MVLPRQCYVWVGAGRATVNSLAAATPTPYDSTPSSTSLISSGARDQSTSLAQRLAMFLKTSVVCSCSLPENSPLLQAFAEKVLRQKLQELIPAA